MSRVTFRLPGAEGGTLAPLEHLPRVEHSEELDQLRHHARPSRQVARAELSFSIGLSLETDSNEIDCMLWKG